MKTTFSIRPFFLVFLLFVSLSNTLSFVPVDKLAFVALVAVSAWLMGSRVAIEWDDIVVLSSLLITFFLSYLASVNEFALIWYDSYLLIFFIVGTWLLAISIRNRPQAFLNTFLIAAAIYLLFGIGAWAYSFLSKEIFYVSPLYGKGRPDIVAALSFATTPQVFASIAALSATIAIYLKKSLGSRLRYDVVVLIALISILVSLNRVWFLFVPVLLIAWGGRRIFFALLLVGAIGSALFPFYASVVLAWGTVESRFMMIENILSFLNKQSFLENLLGRPFHNESYFYMHGSDFYYIESGPFYLLAKFGVLGVFVTAVFMLAWLVHLWARSRYLALFSIYYLIFVQFMTHEFLSISFWFYWLSFICLIQLGELRSSRVLNWSENKYESSFLRKA